MKEQWKSVEEQFSGDARSTKIRLAYLFKLMVITLYSKSHHLIPFISGFFCFWFFSSETTGQVFLSALNTPVLVQVCCDGNQF